MDKFFLALFWFSKVAFLFVKRAEFYVLSRIAHQYQDHLKSLAGSVGESFRMATGLFSGVGVYVLPGYGHGVSPEGKRSAICWEAPICITIFLAHEEVFGLGVEFRGKVLCIRQMQGVRGRRYPNMLEAWPRMLVSGCADFIEEKNFKEIRIYKADQGLFYEYPEFADGTSPRDPEWKERVEVHKQRMRRRYDGTARQMGFEERKKYWVLKNPGYQL